MQGFLKCVEEVQKKHIDEDLKMGDHMPHQMTLKCRGF